MSELRKKQKAARKTRILDAAVMKFRADGYRAVRIEDLAEAAGISVGTVYNYYETKGDILIAVVALEVEEVLAIGQRIVDDPPEAAADAVLTLIGAYYDHSLKYLSKAMWRSAMALSIEAPGTANGQRYAALDAQLAAQVARLIARLQARGAVRADLDAAALGQAVFAVLNQAFVDFVRDEAMTLPDLRAALETQLMPILTLMTEGQRP